MEQDAEATPIGFANEITRSVTREDDLLCMLAELMDRGKRFTKLCVGEESFTGRPDRLRLSYVYLSRLAAGISCTNRSSVSALRCECGAVLPQRGIYLYVY